MLKEWLQHTLRTPCEYTRFIVFDGVHEKEISVDARTYLKNLLISTRNDLGFLAIATQYLGSETVQKHILARQVPRQANTRRGEFGEVLLSTILQEQLGYQIPIPKLRFKITSGQSLPATDALAVKIDHEGKLVEICFVESKLRTTNGPNVAVDAANQLKTDTQENLPAILVFAANMLFKQNNLMFETLLKYMQDRANTKDMETCCIGLCWEESTWDEVALANLENANIDLENVTVHAIRLNNLSSLTDELFGSIGIVELSEDD